MDEPALLLAATCVVVSAYLVHKFMSALSELQSAVAELQTVSALVVAELNKPHVSEADVQAITPLVANVTDSLRRALPVPPPA